MFDSPASFAAAGVLCSLASQPGEERVAGSGREKACCTSERNAVEEGQTWLKLKDRDRTRGPRPQLPRAVLGEERLGGRSRRVFLRESYGTGHIVGDVPPTSPHIFTYKDHDIYALMTFLRQLAKHGGAVHLWLVGYNTMMGLVEVEADPKATETN